MSKRLAIITSHPIQYNAPLFALLSSRKYITVKVFYTWGKAVLKNKFDPGFGKDIKWDIPLLEGYEHIFVNNTSTQQGSHHFRGIINPSLNREVEKWNPDAILIFGWAFVSHLKCIRYFHKKIPVLFRGDSTILRKQSGVKSFLRSNFLKWVYRHIDYALFTGIQNRLYFKKYGLQDRQLIYAPHAIDNRRFADLSGNFEKNSIIWRKKLSINPDELIILYAGKLEAIKSPGLIIELAKKIDSTEVRYIIVGNGPLESSLKEAVVGSKQFIFIDFQNQLNMPVVYRLCDLFILSSQSETWGLSINEAMVCGRGVLVRDTCGCAVDLVINDKNGYVFAASNLDDLVVKLKPLIKNKQLLKSMGDQSVKMIESFSFEHIAKSIESVLEQINKEEISSTLTTQK